MGLNAKIKAFKIYILFKYNILPRTGQKLMKFPIKYKAAILEKNNKP